MQKFLVQIVKHSSGTRQIMEQRYFATRLQAVKYTVDFNRNYDPEMFKYTPLAEFHGPVQVEQLNTV